LLLSLDVRLMRGVATTIYMDVRGLSYCLTEQHIDITSSYLNVVALPFGDT